ncbi:MAG TPA: UDP-N-acetylglucosamine 2-epimerase (non-hydrolyzing) [Candidatus Pacearchaeota archaeon]|nr:UDP-N-acetylglucosamine 2-epimerase (non-hydrolyzing) [Candidatus Pacearchaeota archaeon]
MIAIILGTKAELIKCMPVMLELQNQKKNYLFIHTGQHPLGQACEKFGIKKPDFTLSEEPKVSTKFWSKVNKSSIFWFFSMIFKVRKTLKKVKPKYVLYHGDTMSSAAAAIGSSKLINLNKSWKNVHLEAGLRSGKIMEPFPEEISRIICDKFSDILLAVSSRTEKNLENYKKRKQVINVGNTIIDSAFISYEKAKKQTKKFERKQIKSGSYALINVHRHENINDEKRLKKIVEIIKSIKIQAIWPIHDNTKSFLEKYGLLKELEEMKNLELTPLTDYLEFIYLLANSKYLLTDGGSIQEESLVFKKPCIILREKTERQEGLQTGINFLTKLDVEKTKKIIEDIENNKLEIKKFDNPYGEKGVSKKIVKILS